MAGRPAASDLSCVAGVGAPDARGTGSLVSGAAGNPGHGRPWPSALPRPSALTSQGSSAPPLSGKGRVCPGCLDLPWGTSEAANLRQLHLPHVGASPGGRSSGPGLPAMVGDGSGSAEGPRFASTLARPSVPRLKPGSGGAAGAGGGGDAVLAGPGSQAPASWVSWPSAQEQKSTFLGTEAAPEGAFPGDQGSGSRALWRFRVRQRVHVHTRVWARARGLLWVLKAG